MIPNVRKRRIMFLAVFALLAACASQKGPAEVAIKAAEETVNQAKAEGMKYVPDQMKVLEGGLASAKEKFGKGEYPAALSEAQGLLGKTKEVLVAAKAKREEFNKTWTGLSKDLPNMVEAVQKRVDILSKAKTLPSNLTKEKFEQVKATLASAKQDWEKAQASFLGGSLAEAVSTATSVKEKAVQAMEVLGLPVPEGAKS
jgi:hypothetical protein